MCEKFKNFFVNKIETIRIALDEQNVNQPIICERPFSGQPLNTFTPATIAEVEKILGKSSSKSCALDVIPTWFLKKHSTQVAGAITSIINSSLETHDVPEIFKTAHIRPLLKKSSLDKEVLKNYRPVSNLNFISKLIEKVVANRLKQHFNINNFRTSINKQFHQINIQTLSS